jgi:hypothetical protein
MWSIIYTKLGFIWLKVKNQRTRVGSVFLGASSPNLGHGRFLKWTRLQRLFSRLLTHFFPCIGFKHDGFFLLVVYNFFIGCLSSLLNCLVLFINYLNWLLVGCWSFFLSYLNFFNTCSFFNTLECLEFILEYLGYFISCMGSLVHWLLILFHKHLEVFLEVA